MAQTLYSDEVSTMAEANERFSSEKGLVLLRPRRSCCSSLHFTVPSGCYALVSRHGADEEFLLPDGTRSIVWPPGLHFPYPPWVHISHLVTQQTIVLDLPVKACKTKDNVTVNIDIALAFRIMGDAELGEDPDLVRKFVHELKPRGLEQQLRDAQDEAIRGLARSLKHTEIYGIRSGDNTKHIQVSANALSDFGAGSGIEENVSLGNESKTERKLLDIANETSVLESVEEHGASSLPSEREEKEQLHATEVDNEDSGVKIDGLLPEGVGEAEAEAEGDKSVVGGRHVESLANLAGIDVTEYMKRRLNIQFMPQGVEVLSIMIKSCLLPKEIEMQMEEKTMVISKNAEQRMFHQNNMQNTRMEEEVSTLMQSFEEQRRQEESTGLERINEERVKLNDEIAAANKAEATIREETRVKIQSIQADNNLEVQRIMSRKEETLFTMKAESEKEAAELKARTELETEKLCAEARLAAARNRADASRIFSKAEGLIAPHLAKRNDHLTCLKKLNVYRNLAQNEGLVLCGSDDSDVNAIVVADSILSNTAKRENANEVSVLAELSLVQKSTCDIFSANYPSACKHAAVVLDP